VYFHLPKSKYIQETLEIILPSIQNFVGFCKQATILIPYQLTPRLVNLKVIGENNLKYHLRKNIRISEEKKCFNVCRIPHVLFEE
jgi:hypothetical protein